MIFNTSFLLAQHSEEINTVLQQKWIEKTIIELQKNDVLRLLKPVEPEINSHPEFTRISYRFNGDARIQCQGGDWIYFRSHSEHENSKIGDVCLAITNKGEVFLNYGHICGGIVCIIDKSNTMPYDANDFFNRFISDTDHLPFKNRKSK